MKKNKRPWKSGLAWIMVCLGGIILFFSAGQVVQAESSPFSVTPIFPENQRDASLGYFDLRVSPGETQSVEFELKNKTDEPLAVATEIRSAGTSMYGEIAYQKMTKDAMISPSLTESFEQLAQIEPVVELAPHESKKVALKMTLPDTPFSGIVLGAVHFTVQEKAEEQKEVTGEMSIHTKLAFQYAVILSESDEDVTADLAFQKVTVDPTNGRYPLWAQLENKTPLILSEVTLQTQIFKGDSRKPLVETLEKGKKLAPNSYYDYPISLDGMNLLAGQYQLQLTVTAKEGEWTFKQPFEITEEKAEKYQKSHVDLQSADTVNGWLIGGIIVAAIVILCLVSFLLVKKNQATLKRRKNSGQPVRKKQTRESAVKKENPHKKGSE